MRNSFASSRLCDSLIAMM